MSVATATPATVSVSRLATELESTLRAQLRAHEELAPLLDRKRVAIRTADLDELSRVVEAEREIVRRLERLEQARPAQVRRLAAALGRPDASTLSALADLLDEPVARRLLALRGQLREAIEHARRESGVLRAATDALSQHLTGMLQSVQGALSAARVYGRGGRVDGGAPLRCAVDLRS